MKVISVQCSVFSLQFSVEFKSFLDSGIHRNDGLAGKNDTVRKLQWLNIDG